MVKLRVPDLTEACAAVVLGMGMTSVITVLKSGHPALAAFGLVITVLAAWLTFRLHGIRRLFSAAGPQSFAELKRQQ